MGKVDEMLSNVHFEHLIWHNELQNFLEEIVIYDQRIQMLLQQYTADDMQSELREFRNEFHQILQDIREWKVTIGQHEMHILEVAKLNGAIKQLTNSQHEDMRDKMQQLRKTMLTLKEKFQYFLMKKI
jgi:hypothetical protein